APWRLRGEIRETSFVVVHHHYSVIFARITKSTMALSEQEVIRRQSKEALEQLGIDPYPAELFDVNVSSKEILENFDPEKNNYQQVSLAGRMMSRRIMGSAAFAELQESSGR